MGVGNPFDRKVAGGAFFVKPGQRALACFDQVGGIAAKICVYFRPLAGGDFPKGRSPSWQGPFLFAQEVFFWGLFGRLAAREDQGGKRDENGLTHWFETPDNRRMRCAYTRSS